MIGFVSVKRRSNLDLKRSTGFVLGTMMASNEALIGLSNGDVTRARSIARIRPDQRWDLNLVNKLQGLPWQPSRGPDDSILECLDNPHLYIDADARAQLEGEMGDPDEVLLPRCLTGERQLPSLRITRADLIKYGFTPGCPRCVDTQCEIPNISSNHRDECRTIIYKLMRQAQDVKLMKWLRDHPDNQAKVGPSIAEEVQPPKPLPPACRLVVVWQPGRERFSQVVTMLVHSGVSPIDATMYVNLSKCGPGMAVRIVHRMSARMSGVPEE